MGRITTRRPVVRITVGADARRRPDTLVVEEPLEIRIAGSPLTVTMRTPGHDVELAAGFLVSEGVIAAKEDFLTAIHCGGPGSGGEANTYNVLDIRLASHVPPLASDVARAFYTTSSCGVCGKRSIEAITTVSRYDVAGDPARVDPEMLRDLPDRLREEQEIFAKTGGLHAAGLFDAASGELLVVREDVGRHNAVDKVVGWALLNDRLPLVGTVLQVSGRAGFELVQKATMAGVPMLTAVSAASSLAVELAEEAGLTLIGFMRGASMNAYCHAHRVRTAERTEAVGRE